MVAKAKVGWTIFALLLIPILVCGQGNPKKGMMNWSNDTPYVRMYNPSTVQTVIVTVQELQNFVPDKGMKVGIHLVTNQNDKLLKVHLGPVWFIDNQDIKIEKGDELEIVGSLIMFEGEEVLIAKTVQKGVDIFTLRNDFGRPVWAGWMRGKGRMN